MSNQMTLPGIPSATFSPGLVGGPLLPVLLDGLKIEKSGPRPVPASRSRSQGKGPELLMRGTYGPTFSASPVPGGPLSSWENRLRQRLAKIGSSECDLTWKASAMSDGQLFSRLVPSTPRTVEIDSGLLLDAAYWSTPRASDGEKGGPNQSFGAGGQPLPAQAYHSAMWPSPTLPSGGQTWPEGTTLAGRKPNGCKAQVTLSNVASALWPTPTAVDGARGLTTRPQDTGIPLPQRVGQVLGMAPAGSSGTTGKRGAGGFGSSGK